MTNAPGTGIQAVVERQDEEGVDIPAGRSADEIAPEDIRPAQTAIGQPGAPEEAPARPPLLAP